MSKQLLIGVQIFVSSLVVCVLAADLLLWLYPSLLPTGIYGKEVFDKDLNTYVFGSSVIYNKARYVVRDQNSDGFLDVHHTLSKAASIRVSFFGDSYVQSVQVPIGEAFWRRIPSQIVGHTIETLAFGKSGWGTLHSLL